MMTTQSEIAEAVADLAALRVRLAEVKALEQRAAQRVREILPVGTERAEYAGLTVSVTQPKRFSPKRAAQLLSPEVLALISIQVTEVDQALAEKMLPGAVFDECREPYGEPRITFGGNK